MPASLKAWRIAIAAPSPFSGGAVIWLASSLMPKPTNSARIVAPRALAWARLSITSTPAPSPSTKPSRSLSNGRLALVGASLRVDNACIAEKPPIPSWLEAFSQPPATITSASPYAINRAAKPIAWVAVVQAVEVARFNPLIPWRIATCPAAIFTMAEGTKNGEILRGPSLLSFTAVSSMVVIPPIPEPIITPIRSGSTCCTGAACNSLIKPACFKACAAAATPYCTKVSYRRASLAFMYKPISNPSTVPAICAR